MEDICCHPVAPSSTGDGHRLADVDTNGSPLRTYIYGPGIDKHPGHDCSWVQRDQHILLPNGPPRQRRAITDSDGDVVESYDYDAWGRTTVYDAENLPLSASGIGNRFAFQGREVSWVTGLYCFRARWYDPVTGRWLSKDPIGMTAGG